MAIRGHEFERNIESLFNQINMMDGVIAVRLEVKRFASGVYKAKQPCDYIVFTGKTVFFFDAKECCSDKWFLSKASDHQIEAMKKAQGMGMRAGFVVWFKKHENPCVSRRFIEDLGKKSYTVLDGIEFSGEMFFGKK